MTTKDRDYRSWIDEELQNLLDGYRFQRDNVVETYTERAELNVEIQLIKQEFINRGKGE
jgi:hypothetical protein|tara:strand:+ start:311 stop:487 length:177 start_codon:yes stop_codon:yes gene_type:complete